MYFLSFLWHLAIFVCYYVGGSFIEVMPGRTVNEGSDVTIICGMCQPINEEGINLLLDVTNQLVKSLETIKTYDINNNDHPECNYYDEDVQVDISCRRHNETIVNITISIHNATVEHSGYYKCRPNEPYYTDAYNPNGCFPHDEVIYLQVLPVPSTDRSDEFGFIEISPGNVVYEGTNVTINCGTCNPVTYMKINLDIQNQLEETSYGIPVRIYENQPYCKLYDEQLGLNVQCVKLFEHRPILNLLINIHNVSVKHSGFYKCRPPTERYDFYYGITSHGRHNCFPRDLYVYLKVLPATQPPPPPICTSDGSTVSCFSIIKDSVRLYRNGILQSVSEKEYLSMHLDLQKDNFAKFTCTVISNGYNRSCDIVPLQISISQHPSEAVTEGQTLIFNCDATSVTSDVNFIWYVGQNHASHKFKFKIIASGRNHEVVILENLPKRLNGENVTCGIILGGEELLNVSRWLDIREQNSGDMCDVGIENITLDTQEQLNTQDTCEPDAKVPVTSSAIKNILIVESIVFFFCIVIAILYYCKMSRAKKEQMYTKTADSPTKIELDEDAHV